METIPGAVNNSQSNQVRRSSSLINLKSISENAQPQVAHDAHGGRFKTTEDLPSRNAQNAAPQGPQPLTPMKLSECTAENVASLHQRQKQILINKALKDGTLFDQMIRLDDGQNDSRLSWELFKDNPELQILYLAYCKSRGLAFANPPLNQDSIVSDFNNLSVDKQTKLLSLLESAAAGKSDADINSKIFKFIKDSLPIPTDLSKCKTKWHVEKLTPEVKQELIFNDLTNGTLFDQLNTLRSSANGQEILKSLAEACKGRADGRTPSSNDAKKCCILLLAWAEANAPAPANTFDTFINGHKDAIISYLGSFCNNLLLSGELKDMLKKLESAPGALSFGGVIDKSTLNGKILKFVTDNLPKPGSILACNKWNIGKLSSREALNLLQSGNITDNLSALVRNDATNSTHTKRQLLALLSEEDSKAFADKLISSDPNLLIALINEGALPNLAHRNEMRLLARELQIMRPAFERGITRGFFGVDGPVNASEWKTVVDALGNLFLGNARKVWQNISNEMARYCFDQQGNIDINKVCALKLFLEQDSFFTQPPLCHIPKVAHMRSQMHEICRKLLNDTNSVRSELNRVKDISHLGSQGTSIIQAMSMDRTHLLSPSEAILASLFTPHRQLFLPTCTINSLINEEIHNHPERLIDMYVQMLQGDGRYTFPSGHQVQPTTIKTVGTANYVTVDLKHGGGDRDKVFKDIKSRDRGKIGEQINRWREEGIKYEASSGSHTSYKLDLPIHNLNDLLFANLFQASNFGKGRTIGIDTSFNFDTMSVYAGRSGYLSAYKKMIFGGTNSQDVVNVVGELKKHAERQHESGNYYMRISTHSVGTESVGGYDHSWHSENIHIESLRALDLDNMTSGKPYPIGDRNWSGWDMSQDIPRLAVRKTDGTPPTFEFGTFRGTEFEKIYLKQVFIYKQSIKR
ncbi:MAG: hypothetical protein LBQ23_00135 [Puniceicoccales bacterium]|jgi:hypothetical protein|nr:hypothetical protein [Puniceicoccales bacterium]